jgi:lipoprotein-releasing system ATP-binding protein
MSQKTKTSQEPRSAGAILRAQNVYKTYRMGELDLNVLHGVDVSIKKGEWLAVLGASGSGKSTLLHLLGGLDTPDQGKVRFTDQDVHNFSNTRLDRFRNQDVGFVFQFYHLLPELIALENVLIGSMIHHSLLGWMGARKKARDRANTLLHRMDLSDRARHLPSELSGGERQRVAIARALINEPVVLLADEPTGNLDAETGEQILQVFKDLHAEGQTIVMVTHNDKVADLADRKLTLEKGKLK